MQFFTGLTFIPCYNKTITTQVTRQHAKVYNKLAKEYENNIPNYYEPTKEAVENLLTAILPQSLVLDVGCGVGVATQLLIEKGCPVECIDLSSKMIKLSQKRNPTALCIVGDFLNYNFTKKYDAIISLAFIHLFPKKTAKLVLLKMYDLIKSPGALYIGTTVSEISKEGWELKQDSFFPKGIQKRYRKHWTQEEFKTTLEEVGFKIAKVFFINDKRQKVWMDFLVVKI